MTFATASIAASIAFGCELDGAPETEIQPDEPGPSPPRNVNIWDDCKTEYDPLDYTIRFIQGKILLIEAREVPKWVALCNADAGCEAVVAKIAADALIPAVEELEHEEAVLEAIQNTMKEWAFNANGLGLGVPGQLQIVIAPFVGQLAAASAGVLQRIALVYRRHARATEHLGAAIVLADPFPQIRQPVADKIQPVLTALAALLVQIGGYTTCVATEFAEMNAVAAKIVAMGPGPFGGFKAPPGGPGVNGAPWPGDQVLFMRDGAAELPWAAQAGGVMSDPYAPLFGPTNPWQGMPTITADFSTAPQDDAAYAMKRCEAPGDNCGPLHLEPICEAALDGGPDCQEWASYRQLWFTYSLPEGIPDAPRILSEIDDCESKYEGDPCGAGMAPGGRCHGGECEVVPAGAPICTGAGGYGPHPAEDEVVYSCQASQCSPGQCLAVATQDPAYQYNLGQFPAIIMCDRLTPEGYAPGVVFSGETVGCRVNIRTDGPPEAAGQLRSAQFRVIHADVEEAWGDEPALHIEQHFEVVWASEVPPSDCYTWDSYEKKWRYSQWSCGNGDFGGEDDGGVSTTGDDGGVFTTGEGTLESGGDDEGVTASGSGSGTGVHVGLDEILPLP